MLFSLVIIGFVTISLISSFEGVEIETCHSINDFGAWLAVSLDCNLLRFLLGVNLSAIIRDAVAEFAIIY